MAWKTSRVYMRLRKKWSCLRMYQCVDTIIEPESNRCSADPPQQVYSHKSAPMQPRATSAVSSFPCQSWTGMLAVRECSRNPGIPSALLLLLPLVTLTIPSTTCSLSILPDLLSRPLNSLLTLFQTSVYIAYCGNCRLRARCQCHQRCVP